MANTEWQSQVAAELQIAIQTERCAFDILHVNLLYI